jgi:hypothetical protein
MPTDADMQGHPLFIAIIAAVAQAVAVPSLQASGMMAADSAGYKTGHVPEAVYKSVDSTGKITYSARRSAEAVSSEKIRLKPPPSADSIKENRQRYEKLSVGVVTLEQARLKRQAEREDEERKRLERLALLRSARPQVIEKTVVVGWNPFWHRYPRGHHYHTSSAHPPRPAGRPQHPTTGKFGGIW